MQSHPASYVPGVLLIPRSCGCLRPFPLTLCAYLSCKGMRGSERQKRVEGDSECAAHNSTSGCDVTRSLMQHVGQHRLPRCAGACIPGGGRTGESWCCLLSSLHLPWLNISLVAPRPVPDIPKSPSSSVTPLRWRRQETWLQLIWFHWRQRGLTEICLAFADVWEN